jgi:hypothetical protein
MITSLFITIVIFQKEHCRIQSMAIKQTFHLDPIHSHLVRPIIGNLDENQMLVENC